MVAVSSDCISIQERLYPNSTCFGCGQANGDGLQLKSYVADDGVVAIFEPLAVHSNGMGSLNGGIIATILDCHSGAAVLLDSAGDEGELTDFWVTAGLELRYRLPTFLEHPCELHASIIERTDSSLIVSATLKSDGKVRVQARSRWARLPQR
jgi:acyl-coenzyme A thioesterase PaaI-like protein